MRSKEVKILEWEEVLLLITILFTVFAIVLTPWWLIDVVAVSWLRCNRWDSIIIWGSFAMAFILSPWCLLGIFLLLLY